MTVHREQAMGSQGHRALDQNALCQQILSNCRTSDARYAGYYSVCGLALRLRDLYKWEKGLDPWIEREPSEILEWIGEKEEAWEALEASELAGIEILGKSYDPFDTEAINGILIPEGLFYGAGYVHSLKPSFFLAQLEGVRHMNGHPVYVLGHELARDLLTIPALSQGNAVVIRKEAAGLFLWDQMFYVKKSGREALRLGLEIYGIRDTRYKEVRSYLATILDHEVECYIRHELGEMEDRIFDRNTWRELIATFPHTPVEMLARTVKDMLADTNPAGTLPYILQERKGASLAFYVAFAGHLRKLLFPRLIEAFEAFSRTGAWDAVEKAVAADHGEARRLAVEMIRLYREGKARHDDRWIEGRIEDSLLRPLGILREKTEEPQDEFRM